MIAFVRGTAEDLTENSVVVDNNGLGLEVFMTGKDLSRITIGKEYKIHTFFSVREDGMQLFGFFSKDDLFMFRLLLNVNGIGPKGALGVLSALSADELRFAVLSDDIKTMSKAPGIGKKTAQKLILELKDKLSLQDAFETKLSHTAAAESTEVSDSLSDEKRKAKNDAVEALTALGYSPTEALRAVRQVPDDTEADVEAILKAALKYL